MEDSAANIKFDPHSEDGHNSLDTPPMLSMTAGVQHAGVHRCIDFSFTEMVSPVEGSNEHSETPYLPKVGMTFESEDDAYEWYNMYAGKIGFSIRKSLTRRRADQTIYQKAYSL